MPELVGALAGAIQAGLGETLRQSPLLAVGTLFGAGVLTSLNPCIYPMIPITAGVIAGSVGERGGWGRRVALTLVYVAGLALVYALLGLLAGLSGSLFGTVSASWWARLMTGTLLLIFGLAMLDVVPVAAPRRLVAWASGLSGGSYRGVFLLGASSGIVAAPCGAPAFAAVLTWVATTGSGALGFAYLFSFSLGMTALLMAVGLFSGTLAVLPRSGAWMMWVRRLAGLLILGAAGYYFWQMIEVLRW